MELLLQETAAAVAAAAARFAREQGGEPVRAQILGICWVIHEAERMLGIVTGGELKKISDGTKTPP